MIQLRAHCVSCNRKRLMRFIYTLQLPFNRQHVKVCSDCYNKYINRATIIESAEVDIQAQPK
jgi:hypothetical protein